jgi:RNA polymerase sigma-70 factor (ECF subfamily)
VLAGERQGAVELYRMLLPAVDRTLRRVLGRREADYDDLVQQSFEQILRTLQDRRFSHACPLTAWATTITARVALTELRRRYRHRRHVEDTPWDSESGMSLNDWRQQTVMRERVLDVRRELGHLAPGYAWVVVLHDLEGHRLADIAVTLGISLTAAQSRLLRARKELVQRCSVGAGIESNTEVSHD